MSGVTGGLVPNWGPNVYRTVLTGQDLTAVSKMPRRFACFLNFTNADASTQTVVWTGADGVNVTKTIPSGGDPVFYGDFATIGTLGSNVTVVAGWIDDASVQLNP